LLISGWLKFEFKGLLAFHESIISQLSQDAIGRYRGRAILPRPEGTRFVAHFDQALNLSELFLLMLAVELRSKSSKNNTSPSLQIPCL
jgi:hypothetical protein